MKAVTIVDYGSIEGLAIRDVEMPPAPTADRVRVRVHAAGLNRADLLQVRGQYPAPAGYPQEIPGLEFAGEVEALGPDARNFKIGQRVFGIVGGGAQAEFVVLPQDHLMEIPHNLDWAQTAAVPEVFITAHDALFTQGRLTIGETLLVHAAASGVGTAAIQLAHAAGAKVFGTSRSAAKLERAAELGLNGSAVINEDSAVIIQAVENWTAGRGVNLILDLVGAAYLEANLNVLAPQGRMLLVGTVGGAKATLNFGTVLSKRLTIIGTALRNRSLEQKATATRLFVSQVLPLLEDGTIRPIIDSVYDVAEVQAAYSRLQSNETYGKVVLSLKEL